MSRVAKMPVTLPKGIEVKVNEKDIVVKGPKGSQAAGVTPVK